MVMAVSGAWISLSSLSPCGSPDRSRAVTQVHTHRTPDRALPVAGCPWAGLPGGNDLDGLADHAKLHHDIPERVSNGQQRMCHGEIGVRRGHIACRPTGNSLSFPVMLLTGHSLPPMPLFHSL